MIDVKCKGCNKILAKVNTMNGAIKCPRCYMVFEYNITSNIFVTDSYDPGLLQKNETSDNIQSETNESEPQQG